MSESRTKIEQAEVHNSYLKNHLKELENENLDIGEELADVLKHLENHISKKQHLEQTVSKLQELSNEKKELTEELNLISDGSVDEMEDTKISLIELRISEIKKEEDVIIESRHKFEFNLPIVLNGDILKPENSLDTQHTNHKQTNMNTLESKIQSNIFEEITQDLESKSLINFREQLKNRRDRLYRDREVLLNDLNAFLRDNGVQNTDITNCDENPEVLSMSEISEQLDKKIEQLQLVKETTCKEFYEFNQYNHNKK